MDQLQRFWFDQYAVRGELVQLQIPWQQAQQRYDYPPAVRALLGEALSAAALLVATVKISGHINLQIQSNGGVSLLLAQADSEGRVRGLARWDDEKLRAAEIHDGSSLRELCPNGRLVIAIEPAKGKRYQGIVGLDEATLADALAGYFLQSEQLPTRFWLSANSEIAAGLMLQKLPQEGGKSPANASDDDDDTAGWQHAEILANTVTPAELTGLSAVDLLSRLFAEDDVRLAEGPQVMTFRCYGCDMRVEQALRSLGREELEEAAAENGGELLVECDFCIRQFIYDAAGIDQLLTSIDIPLQ